MDAASGRVLFLHVISFSISAGGEMLTDGGPVNAAEDASVVCASLTGKDCGAAGISAGRAASVAVPGALASICLAARSARARWDCRARATRLPLRAQSQTAAIPASTARAIPIAMMAAKISRIHGMNPSTGGEPVDPLSQCPLSTDDSGALMPVCRSGASSDSLCGSLEDESGGLAGRSDMIGSILRSREHRLFGNGDKRRAKVKRLDRDSRQSRHCFF